MELIETRWGIWYWQVDTPLFPYAESIEYEDEEDAIRAGIRGEIEWRYWEVGDLGDSLYSRRERR